MLGTVLHTRRSAAGRPRSVLIAALLCLAMLLPALPVQPAAAAPDSAQATSLRAQQPDRPLIAFLRQGNLWLMNEDGSGKRQATISESVVQDFSWSPSGRYLLIQHGGWYRGPSGFVESDAVTELLNVTTGEMWEIARSSEPNWRIASANPPVWATDADELLQVAYDVDDYRTYTLTRVALDGTATRLASFEEPDVCGGPDGPFRTMWQLYQEQHGGGWNRNTYEPVVWSSANQLAWVQPFCGQAWTVDLATGGAEPFPHRFFFGVGEQFLVRSETGSSFTPNLYDPATGSLQPLYEGDVFAAGPDGAIYFTQTVQGAPSTFVSRFDDGTVFGITDNAVEVWRTDVAASEPALVASVPAFGAGVPRVTGDGSAVVFGTVDNPTDMIGVDESGAESYSPDIYADHLKAIRVDIATGEVTVLTDDAILPKPQPAGMPAVDAPAPDEEEPADLTGTPEETAAVTAPPTQFVSTAPVVAIACTTTSEGFSLSTDGPILPEGCSVAEGMRFTVSGANGEDYGSCIIGSAAFCSQPEIWMPVDVEVTVTVDESTIPEGYAVAGGNPQEFTFESKYLNTDAAQWLIVLMPADVAAAQGETPASETSEATGTEAEAVPTTGGSTSLRIEPGGDWIAYVGDDGNIWLVQPDGSGQTQVTTDGTADFPYRQPSWSHDGTMLVFSRQATSTTSEPTYLYLFRDGSVSRLPSVYGCSAAAFMPGDQQLVLGCASDSADTNVPAATLVSDPSMGFVSLANLDGSDWRILMPYPTDSPAWPNVGRAWVWDISVAVDGTILLNWGGPGGDTMALMAPGSGSATRLDSPLETGAVTGKFLPGSDDMLINACKGCYKHTREDAQHTIAWMDRGGAITTTLLVPDPVTRIGMPTISPDGMTLVYTIRGQGYPFYGSMQSRDLASGAEVTIASGMEPAWQPNASVAMERPASAVTSGSATEAASSGQPTPAPPSTTAVPNDFIATWSGRGVQENPYGEWAVTISITGGGVGDVVGTSEYPEESCGGNLILQEVTADSIVLLEQLTYGQQTCADNGTITLSGVDGGGCQFAWSGIGPYGTPSSAGGTLSRPDSATGQPASAPTGGSPSQPGTQDGPPPNDTTQLDPSYIGTYSGTGKQTDPDNEWPITVTFTGGRPGEVIGTVEYPTLGCGGELILDSINANDEWGGFWVSERITYGHDNCIDGGTFAFSRAESGIGITFGWRSPVSETRAAGQVFDAEPGATSAPAGGETTASRGAIDAFIGTWEGTGTQSNRSNTWPIIFTITGGREGEIVGTVDYPTLGCGGELTFVKVLPWSHIAPGIELTEHITYGAGNCIDGGTFELRLAEGGGVPSFRWVSSDGSITARGPIDLAGSDAASAPVDQPAEESGAGTVVEPAGGEASGGPPSIYDDPGAEPVPIEAEDGG
jgi:hypothetical protein